jgi:Fe2+ transport system protein FeoA
MVEPILRSRRLWEVFFVQELNFTPSEADALACRMEHITQPEVAARLSERLGHPATSPTGRPIPNPEEEKHILTGTPLSELQPGMQAEIIAIQIDPSTSEFLRSEGVMPGAILSVMAVSNSGSILLNTSDRKITLSGEIAAQILTTPTQKNRQYDV